MSAILFFWVFFGFFFVKIKFQLILYSQSLADDLLADLTEWEERHGLVERYSSKCKEILLLTNTIILFTEVSERKWLMRMGAKVLIVLKVIMKVVMMMMNG